MTTEQVERKSFCNWLVDSVRVWGVNIVGHVYQAIASNAVASENNFRLWTTSAWLEWQCPPFFYSGFDGSY
jgi:hypothetical protein